MIRRLLARPAVRPNRSVRKFALVAALVVRVAVPSLILFLYASSAKAQGAAKYSFVVASGFLCDSADSGSCPAVARSANGDRAGSTNFFLKKFCLERNRFSRFVWRVNDVVHPKTVVGRKDLQRFSKQSRMPITLITRKPVSGSAILFLNPSLQTKLIDDCAVEDFDAGTSQDEWAVPRVSLGDRGHHQKILGSAEQD